MSAFTPETTYDDYLSEQLVNCLNVQTNVIQNLSQYSQHITYQLVEIRSNVEILAHRVVALQQQQQQSQLFPPIPLYMPPLGSPSNIVPFFQPPSPVSPTLNKTIFSNLPDFSTKSESLLFAPTKTEPPSRNAPFVFGSISSNIVNNPQYDTDDASSTDDSVVPCLPIVKLSPVETKTGEEDENILFCERAKLYRFDTSIDQMKERGIGEMKILQHRTTNTCRVLMRRDHVLKVCANHKITPHMDLRPHRETLNCYVWSTMDFSDGEPKHETLCVRFKTNEQAMTFSKIFNEAKEINKSNIDSISSLKNTPLDDDDIITMGEVKPTIEQIEKAKRFQLPLTFYLYENKPPCKGCRGCRENSLIQSNPMVDANRLNFQNSTPSINIEQLSNFPSGFFPNLDSTVPSLMSALSTWFPGGIDSESFIFTSPPKEHRMIIKAKRSLPSNRVPPPPSPQPTSSSTTYSDSERNSLAVQYEDQTLATQTNQKKTKNFSFDDSHSHFISNYALNVAQNIMDLVKQDLDKLFNETVDPTTDDNQHAISQDNNQPSNISNNSTDSTKTIQSGLPENSNHSVIDSIFGGSILNKPMNKGFSFSKFGASVTSNTDFQFLNSSSSSTTTENTSPIFELGSTDAKPVFGDAPKVTFSDLAKQTSDFQLTNDGSQERIFPGQGSLIFGTNSSATNKSEKEDEEDATDNYEPTITFKPIVKLQSVETKTGEEDENILFCERAKLYHYDVPTKQIKERGVGEMKILQHKTTNVCRILMRREYIFKVCANHKITSQMELKERLGKENAYMWSAVDFADGQPQHETLLVRFKTSDQAERFFKQFNDAKQINANITQQ